MAGLVGYASSDEEDEIEQPTLIQKAKAQPTEVVDEQEIVTVKDQEPKTTEKPKEIPTAVEPEAEIGPIRQHAAPLGPSLPQVEDAYPEDPVAGSQPPGSPYSANRAVLHDLTLPSIPNMDIPPSPPGSPPPTTDKKFAQFLDLKKKGVHFNAKLENSTALKNPSLMDKLMAFAEMDEKAQYETTLPTDLWDPKAFPEWATRGGLKKRQEKVAKEREAERTRGGRTAVEFVSATSSPAKGVSSRTQSKEKLVRSRE